MKRFRILAVAAALTGCGTAQGPQHFYVLDAPPAASQPVAAQTGAPILLLMPTTAPAFYDAQPIVYSRSPGTRVYYRLNSWVEAPSRRFGALLAGRLRDSGAFAVVAATSDGVSGNVVLRTDLEEIYLDATDTAGIARISVTATLTDRSNRSIVGRRRFAASAPASTVDVQGVVRGFDAALGPLLDEIVGWTAETSAKVRPAP